MKRPFSELVQKGFVFLDGATGTELIKKGMPTSVCPEAWILEHPEAICAVQRSYIDAGSNIIYAPTFGANRIKLEQYGLAERTAEINKELARIVSANAPDALCFGDLAPSGLFYFPFGETPFQHAVDIYAEQVEALVAGGVDGIVIETMMDIQEARAALIGARSVTDLPVMVTMTFEENGRTLNGTDIHAALDIMQSSGADAFGCNCSTGPEQMIPLLAGIAPYARIPLIAKPNAGVPKLIDGETVFTMEADTFASYADQIQSAGITICGGCCGTTPQHIQSLHAALNEKRPHAVSPRHVFSCATSTDSYIYHADTPPLYVDTKSADLYVSIGSKQLRIQMKQLAVGGKKIPIVHDTADNDAITLYPGTAVLDIKDVLDNSAALAHCGTDGTRAVLRVTSVTDIQRAVTNAAVSHNPELFLFLLPLEECGSILSSVDITNYYWGVYLSEADLQDEYRAAYHLGPVIDKGACAVSVDGESQIIRNFVVSYNALLGRDEKLRACIQYFSETQKDTQSAQDTPQYPPVFTAVLHGDDASIQKLIQDELDAGTSAKEIVDTQLIPAINEVGDRYERKEYFLPQLIMSADTMGLGFTLLEPILLKESSASQKDGTIVIATVKGDIHDIGKNIVALMLKNYNFDVIDLGKDIDEAQIYEGAQKYNADIVALSALMTTTMTEMKTVIDYARENKLPARFIIGGAVVDQNYAEEIGADGYAADAMAAVKLAKSLAGTG